MNSIQWLTKWLFRSAIFFVFFALLAFALNNPHPVVVHFFFGSTWQTPLVILVFAAFCVGVAVGSLAMVPRWWRHRQRALSRVGAAGLAGTGHVPAAPSEAAHGV